MTNLYRQFSEACSLYLLPFQTAAMGVGPSFYRYLALDLISLGCSVGAAVVAYKNPASNPDPHQTGLFLFFGATLATALTGVTDSHYQDLLKEASK